VYADWKSAFLGAFPPGVGNAVLDAVDMNIDDNPITPEKVWRKLAGSRIGG